MNAITKSNLGPILVVVGIVAAMVLHATGIARGYLFGAVGISLIGFLLVSCTGCSSQSALCYQSIGAADTTVVATNTLFQAGHISQANARTIYSDALLVRAGLGSWWAGIQAGTASDSSVPAVLNSSLQTLLADLTRAQQASPALASRARAVSLQNTAAISPGTLLPILELVVQLLPPIEAEIQTLINTKTVTADQINTALTKLDGDLAALNTSLGPVPVSLFKGMP